MTNFEKRYQAVIVGGGPVGLAFAVQLGLRGIQCALVERRHDPQKIPKGQNLSSRSLEHFHFWGIEQQLRAARIMPEVFPSSSIVAYRDLLSRYWVAPPPPEPVRDYYHTAGERLPQYVTERVLRAKLATLPNVTTRFGWAAKRVEQDANGARILIVQPRGSGRETLSADYIIGCDGARSNIREQAGIERGAADFDQLMVLGVFHSPVLHERLKHFPLSASYDVIDPDSNGYRRRFGRIDGGEKFFFHAPVPPATAISSYDFLALLYKAAGFEFEADFDYLGFWNLRVAVAQRCQVGRVFICGDAAHSYPPYGSYGLDSGLEDAVNLGWKLAATLQGWGSEALLQSYSAERLPIFKQIAEDFVTSQIETDRKFLEEFSPERDGPAFAQAWARRAQNAGAATQTYAPHYAGSPVVMGPPGAVCSAHGAHSFEARAGHHLAPLKLSSGRNVFEELGPDFTLLAFGAADHAVAAFEAAASALTIPLKIIRDSCAGGREAYGKRLILVRPDQYAVWTGDQAPQNARAVLRKATGQKQLPLF